MPARPQDTVQMFSRLNPTVQRQVLSFMGLGSGDVDRILSGISSHSSLTRDNPDIVNQWNQLFGNTVDLTTLGNTIFSDSVHPEDADHNYRNYGAITFNPGHGLVSTPQAGQFGEPNNRGLRSIERLVSQNPLMLAGLAASFLLPGSQGLLGSALQGLGLSAETTSTLSTLFQGLRLGNTAFSLLGGGGSSQQRGGGMNLLQLLGGGGGGNMQNTSLLGDISGLLSLIGLGRGAGLFGGGSGTPEGLMNRGQNIADRADPFGASGRRTPFTNMLTPEFVQNLMNPNPADIQNNPEYQFMLSQGTGAINMGDAAQGTLRSGNRGVELQQFGQGLASNFEQRNFQNNMQRLGGFMRLGGVDQSNPAAAALSMMGVLEGSTTMQQGNLSNLLGALMGGGGGLMSLLGGGGGGGLMSLLGGAGQGIGNLLSSLFSGGGGGGDSIDWQSLLSGVGGGDVSDSLFGGLGDIFGAGP